MFVRCKRKKGDVRKSTAILHKWTEAIAFETARAHLVKAARDWYLANIDVIRNWAEFRKAFGDTFLIPNL